MLLTSQKFQLSVSFFFLFSLFNFSESKAQQIQLLLNPINPVPNTSLFNLSLVNNTSLTNQYELVATLKTRRGKTLMQEVQRVEVNGNSIRSIQGGSLITTTFYDTEFQKMYQSGNALPPLNYVLCVTASNISDQNTKENECIEYSANDFVNILPLYPPEEEVYDPRPLFSWMNANTQDGYSYGFRLVEKEGNQNPNAAMRRNTAIVSMDGILENQLFFPSDASPLSDGKNYVWQISLNYQGEEVSKSDAFEFTYKENIEYIDFPKNLSYVDITEIERGASLYAVGEFKFKYPSNIKNELTAELFEIKKARSTSSGQAKKKKKELNENQFQIELGVNKFELDLKDQVYLKHLKDYQLILKDSETQQSYQFTVKYINPDYIK